MRGSDAALASPSVNVQQLERRACDACFKLKEKCVQIEGQDDCQRCVRLSKTCSSDRPIRAPGRPRKERRERNARVRLERAAYQAIARRVPPELRAWGPAAKALTPSDECMLRSMLNAGRSSHLLAAPKIAIAMHREAMTMLLHNYDDLSDSYYSMCGALASALAVHLPAFDLEANTRRASTALKKFCKTPVPTTRHAFYPWIWAGTMIVLHSHCMLGTNGSPIRRYILSHIAHLGGFAEDFINHPIVSTTLGLEVYDCLLRREVPVIGMPRRLIGAAEECFDVHSELIYVTHELCKTSAALVHAPDSVELHVALEQLEHRLTTRIPGMDIEVKDPASIYDIANIDTQVRAHTTAFLLFIHRLKCPFGDEDEKATMMADRILSDLDRTVELCGAPASWVTFPFLVAAIEATSPEQRRRAVKGIGTYVDGISYKARGMTRVYLRAVWKMRDLDPPFKWIDARERLPPICINHVGTAKAIDDPTDLVERAGATTDTGQREVDAGELDSIGCSGKAVASDPPARLAQPTALEDITRAVFGLTTHDSSPVFLVPVGYASADRGDARGQVYP